MKITYAKEDVIFTKELNRRIAAFFEENKKSRNANKLAWVKAVGLFFSYLLLYFSLYLNSSVLFLLLAYGAIGAFKIFLALNVAHDAAHQSFAKSKQVNDLLLFTFDLLGANGYMWKLRHVHSHHSYTNIPGHDSDIKQSSVVRIFPNSDWRKIHRYQHYYMPILYSCYTLHWLLIRDIKDFFNIPPNSNNTRSHKSVEIARLILGKVFYLVFIIGLPLMWSSFGLFHLVLGFLIMHIVASYTVAVSLASAHVGEYSVFPEPDTKGGMPHSWVIHQIITTTDFAINNTLITHLYGAFNHHVIHHIFPNICHIHYPELTKILIATCRDFNIEYRSHLTISDAISAHFHLLKMRSINQQTTQFPEF